MRKRGLIVTPHMDVNPSQWTLSMNPRPLGPVLRRLATYWDLVDVPYTPNFIDAPMPMTDDVRELETARVLRESIVSLPPGGYELSSGVLRAQWQLLQDNQQKDSGYFWALGQTSQNLAFLPGAQQTDAIEVELHNLLPVPDDAVPIGKILDFKEKRRDELEALRTRLDALGEEIAGADREDRAREKAVEEVRTAVSNAFRAMNERFPARLAVKTSIDVSLGTIVGAVGAIVLAPFTIAGAAAAVGAAALSSISVKPTSKRAELKGRLGPYLYVYDVMKDIDR